MSRYRPRSLIYSRATTKAISLCEVDKRFGPVVALCRVSLELSAGEVVGLVGANGAGKTTLLRIIAGFMDADAGSVRVAGHDPMRDRAGAGAAVGYMPESVPLYPDMRVAEYLAHRARLKGLGRAAARARVAEVCERFGLMDRQRWIIGRLSRGYKQRVGLADALLACPPILLLDEPTSGLDPMQVRELRALIGELAEQHTVLVSSHVLTEIEAMADRIAIMHQGQIAGHGTVAELCARSGLAAGSSLEDVFVRLAGGAIAHSADVGHTSPTETPAAAPEPPP